MSKRGHGDGGIDERGENIYRLRYRVDGKRFSKTFRGTLSEARKELRGLVRSGETGEHVDPIKLTVGSWIDQWIAAGAPGRKKKKVGQRTLEHYEELLRVHIKPTLGSRPLQKLRATEIDKLYGELESQMAPMTLHHVHTIFNSCLSAAERKGLVLVNPMNRAERIPSPGESDHGLALDEADLHKLVAGFPPLTIYPIVALTAAIGARQNEVLAFRWADFDPGKKTIRVERAIEMTKKFGIRFKPPKTWRGLRTVALNDGSVSLLLRLRETHLRLRAAVSDGAQVDLILVKLPEDALMFHNPPEPGEDFSFSAPRLPQSFSVQFAKRAGKLGFPDFHFHPLRGTHATPCSIAASPFILWPSGSATILPYCLRIMRNENVSRRRILRSRR
jgi:integrase